MRWEDGAWGGCMREPAGDMAGRIGLLTIESNVRGRCCYQDLPNMTAVIIAANLAVWRI